MSLGTHDNEAAEAGPPGKTGPAPTRKSRNALFLSIFLIELGSSMTTVALPLFLLERHGMNAESGFAFAARLLPGVLLGPIVGDAVAHRDPRRVAAISALCGALFIAVIPWTTSLAQIQVVALAIGACHMFSGPSRLALRSKVLEEGEELAGNGLMVTVERLPSLIGPAIAGGLLVVTSFTVLFLAEAVACLAAAGLVLLVPTGGGGRAKPAGEETRTRPTALGSLLKGTLRKLRRGYRASVQGMITAVTRDRFLLGLTLTGFTYVAAMSIGRMLLLRLADDRFPGHAGFYGYLLVAMALGAVVGGLVVRRLTRVPNGLLYILGNVIEAMLWILVVLAPWPPLALGLLFLAGINESIATAVFFAEAQFRLPDQLAGHYYAALVPLADVFALLGSVVGAVVAAHSLSAAALTVACLIAVPVLLTPHWYLRKRKPS